MSRYATISRLSPRKPEVAALAAAWSRWTIRPATRPEGPPSRCEQASQCHLGPAQQLGGQDARPPPERPKRYQKLPAGGCRAGHGAAGSPDRSWRP